MKLYAIWHKPKRKLLTFTIASNADGEFCSDTRIDLELYDHQPVYVHPDTKQLQYMIDNPGAWWSSSMHKFKPTDLKIVELVVKP